MRKKCRAVLCGLLVLSMFVSPLSGKTVYADEKIDGLERDQRNAIEMLNYITVLTQEINASKNSRLYMEEAYSSLINNTYPNAVDGTTLSQMTGLLDTMEKYRMVDVKRERLQYVYDQNQAQAIRAAIPNPMGLLSAVVSADLEKIVASIAYMAVDSATSYNAYTSEAEKQYLQEGWALDDEEAAVLHESRKGTFSYMVRMVNDYTLPGDLTLTERTVKEFVDSKNNSNLVGKKMFLETNGSTYKAYGEYWLVLAECYYKNGEYKKCLDAISTYEESGVRIFRKDYDLARILPLAIAAAKETYKNKEYADFAYKHANMIIENSDHDDWALRYFATQTLVDLYATTKDKKYLNDAYTKVRNNVNYLLAEQKDQNEAFLAPVKDVPIPDTATKEKKKEIKKYNKMQKESRKSEMPPVYEPLLLNCELLFAVADELKISAADKKEIDSLLHESGTPLFLVKPIDDMFWFDKSNVEKPSDSVELGIEKSGITLPAEFYTKDATIKVTVLNADNTSAGDFSDWKLDEVKRGDEGDITTFSAIYTSPTYKKFKWKPDMKIQIDTVCMDGLDKKYHFDYKTVGTKNKWYDYGKVWENEIKFEPGK